MRGRALLTVLLVTACSGRASIAPEELAIRCTLPDGFERAELGRAFPLEVTRVWRAGLVPAAWNERALAPLVVRLEDVTTRTDGEHFEERRTYRAYAFQRDSIRVPALRFEAVPETGGPAVVASTGALELPVQNLLEAETPGAVELPREPFPAPRSWTRLLLLGAASCLFLVLLAAGLRRRAALPAPVLALPAPTHRTRALERLARLRDRTPLEEPEIQAYFVEASAAVREFSAAELGVRAAEMTTEELLRAPETARGLQAGEAGLLRAFLARCDLVKFARHAPAAVERERALEDATRFVAQAGSGSSPA